MAEGYFITPAQTSQVEMREKIHRRTMGITDEVMLCEFFLQRDALIAPHSHLNDQVGYVVFGLVEMTIGDKMQVIQPGLAGAWVDLMSHQSLLGSRPGFHDWCRGNCSRRILPFQAHRHIDSNFRARCCDSRLSRC